MLGKVSYDIRAHEFNDGVLLFRVGGWGVGARFCVSFSSG